MAATTIYCGNFDFVASAGTNWWTMGMGGGNQPAQAERSSRIHAAGVADRVGIMVAINDRTTATTFTTQINGVAGSVSITVPAGQTGWFDDPTHADTLAAGDEYTGVLVVGTGGTNFRTANVRYRWTPTTVAGITLHGSATEFATGVQYTSVGGSRGVATAGAESSVQQPVAAGTLRRLQIQMRTNTSGSASTVTLRVNGVDTAMAVTIPANQTGLFEDATTSVGVQDGDLVSLRWNANTGGTTWRTWRHQITHDATDAVSALASWATGVTVPAGASRYGPPNLVLFDNNGHVLDSPTYRARVATPAVVEQCWLWVTANAATTDSFFRLLKNQVSVAGVTIPAGQVGAFSFAPGTAFADGDDIGWEIAAGTGGGVTVTSNAFRLAGGTPISQSSVSATEWRAGVTRSAVPAVESLGGVSGAATVAAEILAQRISAALSTVEFLAGLSRSASPAVESLAGVGRASLLSWESVAGVSRSSASPLESLTALLATSPATAIEILAQVSRSSVSAAEFLARVSRDQTVALELLAALSRQSLVAWEAAGTGAAVARASIVGVEWLQAVAAPRVSPAEWLHALSADSTAPAELLAGVSRLSAVVAEVLGTLQASSAFAVEILALRSRVSTVAAEILAALAEQSVITVAWDGSVVTIRILRGRDFSAHRLRGLDHSTPRLAGQDHSTPRLRGIDHSGVS